MIDQINPDFQQSILPQDLNVSQLREIIGDYEAIILSNLNILVDRYNRDPDYRWVDTKFSSITGEDFPEDDFLRGPNTVYGWIQGRALEALSVHANWLRNHDITGNFKELLKEVERILSELLQQICEVRQKNNGHLYFFLTPEGKPFILNSENKRNSIDLTSASPFNYTDIFVAKGMYAAAIYLQNHEILEEAKQYCLKVYNAILNNDFISDQPQFDSRNDVKHMDDRISHGPFMLQISTASLLAGKEKNVASIELGLDLLRHISHRHVNLNERWPQLEEFDFVEFIDKNNVPYSENNIILSDPGHSLEFVGLALEFVRILKNLNIFDEEQKMEIAELKKLMPSLLVHNFSNGFCERSGGICKTFDLISRKPANSDMPWWSLPETISASLECWNIAASNTVKRQCLDILRKCHNSFVLYYVQPERHLLSVQTRDQDGEYVDVIPATPDYDPGYHTGICLIKSIEILKHCTDQG